MLRELVRNQSVPIASLGRLMYFFMFLPFPQPSELSYKSLERGISNKIAIEYVANLPAHTLILWKFYVFSVFFTWDCWHLCVCPNSPWNLMATGKSLLCHYTSSQWHFIFPLRVPVMTVFPRRCGFGGFTTLTSKTISTCLQPRTTETVSSSDFFFGVVNVPRSNHWPNWFAFSSISNGIFLSAHENTCSSYHCVSRTS